METFSLAKKHSPMAGLTISSKIDMESEENSFTCFSLGKGTSISAEAYNQDVLYIANGVPSSRKAKSRSSPREKY